MSTTPINIVTWKDRKNIITQRDPRIDWFVVMKMTETGKFHPGDAVEIVRSKEEGDIPMSTCRQAEDRGSWSFRPIPNRHETVEIGLSVVPSGPQTARYRRLQQIRIRSIEKTWRRFKRRHDIPSLCLTPPA